MQSLPVPLLKQKHLECGPTALAMVFEYFGKKIPPKNIANQIRIIANFGVKTITLAQFAKDTGFESICYSYNKEKSEGKTKIKIPSKKDIVRFLKLGLPVILSIRSFLLYDETPSEMGHFIVITGYDEGGTFAYNDPKDGKYHEIDEEKLLFAWHNNIIDSSAYLLVIKP